APRNFPRQPARRGRAADVEILIERETVDRARRRLVRDLVGPSEQRVAPFGVAAGQHVCTDEAGTLALFFQPARARGRGGRGRVGTRPPLVFVRQSLFPAQPRDARFGREQLFV